MCSWEEMLWGSILGHDLQHQTPGFSALSWELKYLKMTGERKVGPGIAQSEVSSVAVSIERNGNANRQLLTGPVFQLDLQGYQCAINHPLLIINYHSLSALVQL